jgi:hypothetical protein
MEGPVEILQQLPKSVSKLAAVFAQNIIICCRNTKFGKFSICVAQP